MTAKARTLFDRFEELFARTGCTPRRFANAHTFGAEFLATTFRFPIGEMIARCAEASVPLPTFDARGFIFTAYWPEISWASWQDAKGRKREP